MELSCCCRRILLFAAGTGEGPLTEPRAAAQAWPRELVFIPFWRPLPLYSMISPTRGSRRPERKRGAPNNHRVGRERRRPRRERLLPGNMGTHWIASAIVAKILYC